MNDFSVLDQQKYIRKYRILSYGLLVLLIGSITSLIVVLIA